MVRSPLGLPLGDRGLLPLPDALPGVGAGVVAGGPYTVPKGCWIPIPGRPAGRGQGLFHEHTRAAWPRTAITSGATLPFRHCSACCSQAVFRRRILQGGGSLLRPPAHVRATGLSGLGAGRPTGAPVSHPSLTHAHTRHTRPGLAVPLKPLSGGLHWSGCLAAGRRCGALEARRTGAASLRDGHGQGAWWGRGGSRERS